MTRQSRDVAVVRAIAPGGTLRAAINVGNPMLANRDPAGGEPVGVSVDLAREFARRLGVPVELVVFDRAMASVEAVREEQADIGFFAIDPARSDGLRFTASYVVLEGSYLVRSSSPLTDNGQVDHEGQRISVNAGSAYDLYLTRQIRQAEIVRLPGTGFAALRSRDVDVAAGIRRVLEAHADREPGFRVLPGHFMLIQQAMGLPAGRGADAQAVLAAYVEEQKASGFVARSLAQHGIEGAIVAAAAS